jgi:nucleoside triphosphate pyrophosphatase
VLASASPRRREILKSLAIRFRVAPSNITEEVLPGETPERAASRLAREKAQTAARHAAGWPVLAADTIVVVDADVLGKPRTDRQAREMLRRLSGRWHEVITAVCLGVSGRAGRREAEGGRRTRESVANAAPAAFPLPPADYHFLTEVSRSRVLFAPLSKREIEWYVSTGEQRDKAGAYAVQGLGARFIEAIEGSFTNVMGLPARTVYEMLLEAGLEGLALGRYTAGG